MSEIEDICDTNTGHNVRQNINKYNKNKNIYTTAAAVRAGARACAHTREETAASPIGELTDDQLAEIVDIWNRQELAGKIYGIHRMTKREEQTRICVSMVGFDQFVLALGKVDQQAWFRKLQEEENKLVRYEWLTKPDNFQNFIEGAYEDAWKKKSDDQTETFEERLARL